VLLLSWDNIFRLRTFLALSHFHCYGLTFFQCFETISLNRAVVYEYVWTISLLNEYPNPFASLNHLTVPVTCSAISTSIYFIFRYTEYLSASLFSTSKYRSFPALYALKPIKNLFFIKKNQNLSHLVDLLTFTQ